MIFLKKKKKNLNAIEQSMNRITKNASYMWDYTHFYRIKF